MRILLHMCCGPCAIMPARELLRDGHTVTGWFYNPNIHPLAEYLRRREGAARVAAGIMDGYGIDLLFPDLEPGGMTGFAAPEYDVAVWCREALGHPEGRCVSCRVSRFDAAAAVARNMGFDAFTSSLLYSRHQDHEGMRAAGEAAAARTGTVFFYRDFRPFWQGGIAASKELGIYRQQYCGCVFSEEDRYARDLAKTLSAPGGE